MHDILEFKPQVQFAAKKYRIRFDQQEDLEQEGYIALLEIQEKLFEVADRDPEEAKKLAYTTARTRIMNCQRNAHGPITVSLSDEEPKAAVAPVANFESASMQKAIKQLSDEDAYILTEIFYLEKPERIVAEALGKTQPWVHRRKTAALASLKKILGEQ